MRQQGVGQVHACREATGEYGAALALFLSEAGDRVSLVTPARRAADAKRRLVRTKTDKADAALIAHCCQTQQPLLWTPPAAAVRELQALVRRVELLQAMAQQEVNRRQSGSHSPAVLASLEATLAFLRAEMAKMHRRVQAQLERSAQVQQQSLLLRSLPGVGAWTAARVLSAIDAMRRAVAARQLLAASAGWTPHERTSGSSVHRPARLAKTGTSRLRRALSRPAIVAMRHHPAVRALAERLRARGTRPMVIVGAALPKLLQLISGVLTSGTLFAPKRAMAA